MTLIPSQACKSQKLLAFWALVNILNIEILALLFLNQVIVKGHIFRNLINLRNI